MSYKTVSLPEKLHDAITDFISSHPEKGYISIAEFVKEAVRNQLTKFSDHQKNPEIAKMEE